MFRKLIFVILPLLSLEINSNAQSVNDSLLTAIDVNAINIFAEQHLKNENITLELKLFELAEPHVNKIVSLQERSPSILYEILNDVKNEDRLALKYKWRRLPETHQLFLQYIDIVERTNIDFYPIDIEENYRDIGFALYELASKYNSESAFEVTEYSDKLFRLLKFKKERYADSIRKYSGHLLRENIITPFDSIWLLRILNGMNEFIGNKKLNKGQQRIIREKHMAANIKEAISLNESKDSVFIYGLLGMAHVNRGLNKLEDSTWQSAFQILYTDFLPKRKLNTFLILYEDKPVNELYYFLVWHILSPEIFQELKNISKKQKLIGSFPVLENHFDYFINAGRINR